MGEYIILITDQLLIIVFSLLLEHLKKFPVSATGGLMLAKFVLPITSFTCDVDGIL